MHAVSILGAGVPSIASASDLLLDNSVSECACLV